MKKIDYFCSSVYQEDCQNFLTLMKYISGEYHQDTSDYNFFQSNNFAYDTRIGEFVNYVAQSAWNILDSQGYYMNKFETRLNELWLQIYHKHDYMYQHVHSNNSQMTGFFFLDVPENSGRIILFDPRNGKNQINLPEKNKEEITYASEVINFHPYPGMLFITNSWLSHGISKHMNEEVMKVIHFNVTVKEYVPPPPPAEVI